MTHEIVDVTRIAELLDVKAGTVHQWRKRYDDFPAPLKTLKIGPIWDRFKVEQWARETGRL